MTALLGLAALDFGRLLVVAAIAQLLERTFLVELLLQTAQGAVDDFTFFDANFGIMTFTPFAPFYIDCNGNYSLNIPPPHHFVKPE